MNKFLFCLSFLISLHVAKSQTTNTNISNGIVFDGEPYLAINPTNPQNLVAAWMGLKFSGGAFRVAIKTRASFDGGNSWSAVKTLPHFSTSFGSADESMVFDKNGLLYLAYIDYRQLPDSGGIYVARSLNGGLNWDTPSKAFDAYDVPNKRPIDRPWLVVDQSDTPNAGTLYITSKPAPWVFPPNRNYFKASSDGGHNWTPIANVDGGTHLVGNLIAQPMAAPATTRNGKFCAVYPSYVVSQNTLPAFYLASSKNKGQTFDYSTVMAAATMPMDTNFKNGYRLLANPADSNQMAFFLPSMMNGDADILALHSNNGGQTWSSPVRVNDDPVANGKAQDMVWAAYNGQGKLAVTWRDRRDANANGFWNAGYDFYYATSSDNGQTFSKNQKLSSQFVSFDSVLIQSGNDFMSCTYLADTLYTLWGDTRTGRMNIYFSKTIASSNMNVGTILLNGEAAPWEIYPNPTPGDLNISVGTEWLGQEMWVLDMHGRIIQREKILQPVFQVSTARLLPGSYILRIGMETQKFVKE
jgi:hypothetical protein